MPSPLPNHSAGPLFRCGAALFAASLLFALAATRLSTSPALRVHPNLIGEELFTDGAVHDIAVEIAAREVESLRARPREYVAVTLRSGPVVFQRVALRLKGSSGSFRAVDDKPALTVDFARFNAGQRFHGLRRIYLNNSVADPSTLNEQFGAELFRAAGVPAPRVSHARVRLNGRELGFYVLKEGFTEDFLSGSFRRADGNLYDNDLGHDVDQVMHRNLGNSAQGDQSDVIALAEAAREPDLDRRWQRLGGVLDLDRFVTLMALEVLLVHQDGYCLARNNFRLYHDPDSDHIVFLPDGMDQLLGLANFPWKPHFAGLVAASVMETPRGQKRYAERFASLLETVFQVERLTNRVDQWLTALRPNLSASEFQDLSREAATLKKRRAERHADLRRQLAEPELKLLEFTNGEARVPAWFKVDEPAGGRLDRARSPDGVASLHFVAGPVTSASWRAKVLLRRGRYRFVGRGATAGVTPLPFGRFQGAGLRVGGRTRTKAGLVGDAPWQPLTAEFQVDAATEEVELLCELVAGRGEFWVDLHSLRAVKIGPTPPTRKDGE